MDNLNTTSKYKKAFIMLALIFVFCVVVFAALYENRIGKTKCRPVDDDPRNDGIEVKICELYPKNAIDCGTDIIAGGGDNLTHEFPGPIDKCVMDALEKHQPVVVRRVRGRTDTIDYTGLVVNSKGEASIIEYTWFAIGNAGQIIDQYQCSGDEISLDKWYINCSK